MAIPQISEKSILDAFKYIDEHGVPDKNRSTKYEVVIEDGKKYPPKYVILLAAKFENRENISADSFTSDEAKLYLQNKGYSIEVKQIKYELTITAKERLIERIHRCF